MPSRRRGGRGLWIGTYDGGLKRFADGRFTAIRKKDGLFDEGVFAIVDDGDGRYWMSSNRGVFAVAKKELEAFAAGKARRVSCRAWRNTDGMPSSECNGGRQPSGLRARDGTPVVPHAGRHRHPRSGRAGCKSPRSRRPWCSKSSRRTAAASRHADPVELAPGGANASRRATRRTRSCTRKRCGSAIASRASTRDWVEAGNRRFAPYSYVPPGRYTLHDGRGER